jgi:hypothetical protein
MRHHNTTTPQPLTFDNETMVVPSVEGEAKKNEKLLRQLSAKSEA